MSSLTAMQGGRLIRLALPSLPGDLACFSCCFCAHMACAVTKLFRDILDDCHRKTWLGSRLETLPRCN